MGKAESNAVPIEGQDLRDLATQINEATTKAEQHAKSAMTHALAAGNLLIQVKQQVGHGMWEMWLTSNTKVAPRTARAYMKLAKTIPSLPEPDRQRVADLPVREAIKAIATSPDQPQRQASIRVKRHDTAERAANAFRRSAKWFNAAARQIEFAHMIPGHQVQALKSALTSALAEVERIEIECAVKDTEEVVADTRSMESHGDPRDADNYVPIEETTAVPTDKG